MAVVVIGPSRSSSWTYGKHRLISSESTNVRPATPRAGLLLFGDIDLAEMRTGKEDDAKCLGGRRASRVARAGNVQRGPDVVNMI